LRMLAATSGEADVPEQPARIPAANNVMMLTDNRSVFIWDFLFRTKTRISTAPGG
jgi:hypothetical protein